MNHRGVLSCPFSLQSSMEWMLTASYILVTSLTGGEYEKYYAIRHDYQVPGQVAEEEHDHRGDENES